MTRQDKDILIAVVLIMACLFLIAIGSITGLSGQVLILPGVACGVVGGLYLRWGTIGR